MTDHRYLALDLWMATGRSSRDFETFCDQHGFALTWSLLLAEVRGPKPPCLEPVDQDDYCVFDAGHSGPHWGADDVASPVFLPARIDGKASA